MASKKVNTILSLTDKMSKPLVKVADSVKGTRKELRELQKSANQINKWKNSSVKAIDSVIKKTVKWGAVTAVAFTGLAIKTSIGLEDAFSGVRKTVDATEEEFTKIRSGLNDLAKDIPIAVEELYGIGEAAGQLGIAKENLVSFTDVMAKLGVSTNLSSDEAATALARLANITGMPQTEFDRLGSTVVDLGNNLATTEAEIVEMGLRLAGTGAQVGLTEAQILALSGVMSSVGIQAQAGGSAMSRAMQKINTQVLSGGKHLSGFAKVAGMTATEFSKTWKEKPTEALVSFVKGLDGIKKSGGDVTSTLKKLGIESIQEISTLLSLAGANDVLVKSLKIGDEAWKDNIALNNEAAEKFGTTKSKIQLLKNSIVLAANKIGQIFLPYVNDAVEALIPFVQKLGDSKDKIKEVIDKVIEFGKEFVDFINKHKEAIIVVGSFATGMYAAIKAIEMAKAVILGLRTASLLLNGTLAMTPLGWLVIGIGLVIAAGVALYRNWDKIKEAVSNATQRIRDDWQVTKDSVVRWWGEMTTAVSDSIEKIKEYWEGLKEFFKNPIKGTVNILKNTSEKRIASTPASFQPPGYPRFAKGTSYSPAGFARIHEEGGEIRRLSSGETIIPADKSERLLKNKSIDSGIVINVNIDGNIYGEADLINVVGNTVVKKVKLALGNV